MSPVTAMCCLPASRGGHVLEDAGEQVLAQRRVIGKVLGLLQIT